jgi:hypothetical protein
MKIFKKKQEKVALIEESIRELRDDVDKGLKHYGTHTLFNGDGGAVRDYDEVLIFLDFIHVNNAAIAMKDIDLYRFSGWTGMALNPNWWNDLTVKEKAEAWFSNSAENMTFRERYSDPGFAKLLEAISNMSGALMALLQSFDDFDDILTAKAEVASEWASGNS